MVTLVSVFSKIGIKLANCMSTLFKVDRLHHSHTYSKKLTILEINLCDAYSLATCSSRCYERGSNRVH